MLYLCTVNSVASTATVSVFAPEPEIRASKHGLVSSPPTPQTASRKRLGFGAFGFGIIGCETNPYQGLIGPARKEKFIPFPISLHIR